MEKKSSGAAGGGRVMELNGVIVSLIQKLSCAQSARQREGQCWGPEIGISEIFQSKYDRYGCSRRKKRQQRRGQKSSMKPVSR